MLPSLFTFLFIIFSFYLHRLLSTPVMTSQEIKQLEPSLEEDYETILVQNLSSSSSNSTSPVKLELDYLLYTIQWLLKKLQQSAASTSNNGNHHQDILQYIMFIILAALFILKILKKITTWFRQ